MRASRRARLPCGPCSRRAARDAFGDADGERLLASVLTRGYLDPAPSHEVAANELNLSRAAYFRRLKQASERLAEYLAGTAGLGAESAVPSGVGPTLTPCHCAS